MQVLKKQKLKGKGGTKTILKEEKRDTFFNFFKPPSISMDTERAPGDDELVSELDTDFDIGLGIKMMSFTLSASNNIKTSPIEYYNTVLYLAEGCTNGPITYNIK